MMSALAKGMAVLEAISRAKGPVRLSALATDLEMQKSTVHRILGELIDMGYVAQDEATGLYRPTLRTWEIGTSVVADLPIKQVAAGSLQQLHDETGETVSLTVRSGLDALYLDKIISPRPMRFTTRVGSRVPLPLAASGKALLVYADDGEGVVRRVAGRTDLAGRLDVDAVLKELVRGRQRGYVTSSARRGVMSVAAPILDRAERPVAALSVSYPTDRVPASERSAVVESVLSTALHLAESLGRL